MGLGLCKIGIGGMGSYDRIIRGLMRNFDELLWEWGTAGSEEKSRPW